jgi:hypothetical protein
MEFLSKAELPHSILAYVYVSSVHFCSIIAKVLETKVTTLKNESQCHKRTHECRVGKSFKTGKTFFLLKISFSSARSRLEEANVSEKMLVLFVRTPGKYSRVRVKVST